LYNYGITKNWANSLKMEYMIWACNKILLMP
jgi:hypothetical protein